MKAFSYRDTWAEISLNHIEENFLQLKQWVNPHAKIMTVVKADGYGHGAVEVSKTAIQAGADYLAVAFLDEAIELRAAGITAPILILGYTPVHSVKKAIQHNITLTVFDHDVLDEIIIQSSLVRETASIHLKVDTGMSRIGVTTAMEVFSLAKKAAAAPFVDLEGIFTHFANADSEDTSFTESQFKKFQTIVEYLANHHLPIPLKHCCNSAATMKFPRMHLDMVRIGIALYGFYPDASLKNLPIKLKQAMSLKTKIVAIKTVPISQPVSYGCTWKASCPSRIATLPIGYADGLSRYLSNRGHVLIHGQKSAIAGRVCMDQTMIDVTHIQPCSPGDEVTIFGADGSAFQSVDEVATLMGTIHYEVVCLIGKRVPRIYVKKNKLFALAGTPENHSEQIK